MADSNGRGGGTGWKVAGIVAGLALLMISVSINFVQASVAAQTRDRVEEYRLQQRDQELRLRAVEVAVGEIPYIRRTADEIKALLERHMQGAGR